MSKSRRRHTVTIKINADAWIDVIHALSIISEQAEGQWPDENIVVENAGSGRFSWIFNHDEDESISHDT